jgi:hypothetical protein
MKDRIEKTREATEALHSPSFMRLFGQMMILPFTAFAYGMGVFVRTLQGMQTAADKGMDAFAGDSWAPTGHPFEDSVDKTTESGTTADAGEIHEEERKMADYSLSNDQVKVVQYTILSVKPDEEHALKLFDTGTRTRVFTDNMTGEDFTGMVIAEYFEEAGHETIPDEDRKYLRVSYTVLSTFAPYDANYERKQVDVLKQIAIELKRPHK